MEKSYNVQLIATDPNDPTHEAKMSLDNVPLDKFVSTCCDGAELLRMALVELEKEGT